MKISYCFLTTFIKGLIPLPHEITLSSHDDVQRIKQIIAYRHHLKEENIFLLPLNRENLVEKCPIDDHLSVSLLELNILFLVIHDPLRYLDYDSKKIVSTFLKYHSEKIRHTPVTINFPSFPLPQNLTIRHLKKLMIANALWVDAFFIESRLLDKTESLALLSDDEYNVELHFSLINKKSRLIRFNTPDPAWPMGFIQPENIELSSQTDDRDTISSSISVNTEDSYGTVNVFSDREGLFYATKHPSSPPPKERKRKNITRGKNFFISDTPTTIEIYTSNALKITAIILPRSATVNDVERELQKQNFFAHVEYFTDKKNFKIPAGTPIASLVQEDDDDATVILHCHTEREHAARMMIAAREKTDTISDTNMASASENKKFCSAAPSLPTSEPEHPQSFFTPQSIFISIVSNETNQPFDFHFRIKANKFESATLNKIKKNIKKIDATIPIDEFLFFLEDWLLDDQALIRTLAERAQTQNIVISARKHAPHYTGVNTDEEEKFSFSNSKRVK